jgi:hypothetical protein
LPSCLQAGLGFAIAIASLVYCLAGVLLLVCMAAFIERDTSRNPPGR